MLEQIYTQLKDMIATSLSELLRPECDAQDIHLDIPADKKHGEYATNAALQSARILKKPPMSIARDLVSIIEKRLADHALQSQIKKIEVKSPGFINFYLSPEAFYQVLYQVFEKQQDYGRCDFGQKEKILVEFVSANPTGPLSVAHARQAAVGDAFVNILNHLGFEASKEYYLNDAGNQINILAQSIQLRAREKLGASADFPDDHYQGEYIKDMAKIFIENNNVTSLSDLEKIDVVIIREFGVTYLLNVIKQDLNAFRVYFDYWSHESQVASKDKVAGMVDYLVAKDFIKEEEGALWFKSTMFGDDKDRVLKKSNGDYTYLAPDIVYHQNKFDRGFSRVFDMLGPDHHGYIPRLKAAAQALGRNKDDIEVLIVQLVTLYRQGEMIKMSTRLGQYVTLREVINEVGVDAARFFFLMRHIKVHLDFDLELAKQETSENPVYYIQYAYARINSINKKAKEAHLTPKTSDLSLLSQQEEIDLIKKIGQFTDTLKLCYQQYDPYPLVSYLQEIATIFHKFYDCHRVIDPDEALRSSERLALANATRMILANGLQLLGLSTPERM
ncbi:MAG: arginine--tRNA ligase [Candidatus Omnitrophica bacterium]|nr:arginine--tRNA ligase [Candidatus Omnitrophota bacterium]